MIVDYLIDVKSIFDSLITIEFPILDTNFMECVIDGLGLEY